MISIYFWILVGLVLIPLLAALWKPLRIYEYPYFMTAAFAIFILPQAISLIRFPGAAPEHAVQNVLLVSCLCLGACLIGYQLSSFNRHVKRAVSRPVDEKKLFRVGVVFVACGYFFGYLLSHMEIQSSETGGWTGTATIYNFFQQLCYPGFAICLMTALRHPGLLSLLSTIAGAVIPLQTLAFGRREPAALFLVTLGLTLYFRKGLKPPRWIIPCVIIGSLLAIPATGTYRGLHAERDWEAIKQMDLIANFKHFVSDESILELRNAAILIEATQRSGDYGYGADYWNHLIFRYVPAQILGPSFKESLMIRRSGEGQAIQFATMDYVNPEGSTVTGMGDSFQQFGYWGCLFFVALAMLFRSLWQAALRPDALFAQLLYMQSCTSAMRAITHWTLDFLPGFLYSVIFLGAAMWYASSRTPEIGARRAARRGPVKRRPDAVQSRHLNGPLRSN